MTETSPIALLSEAYEPPLRGPKFRIRVQHADGRCSIVEAPVENGVARAPGEPATRILNVELVA